MKKGFLIYSHSEDKIDNAWIIQRFQEVGLQYQYIIEPRFANHFEVIIHNSSPALLYQGHPTEIPDFIIFRCSDALLRKPFEQFQIPVFNRTGLVDLYSSKIRTLQYLSSYKIPVMDTSMVTKKNFPVDAYHHYKKRHGIPFVLKDSNNEFFIETQTQFESVIQKSESEEWIIQSFFVPTHEQDRNLRVYVCKNEIVGAVGRDCPMQEPYIQLIEELIRVFRKDMGIVAIDLFRRGEQVYFQAIDSNPEFHSLYPTRSSDIIEKIMAYVQEKIEKRTAKELLHHAKKYLGKPYYFAAKSTEIERFDCSSFVQRCYRDIGYVLPRNSRLQSQMGTVVKNELRPGDLLFYTNDKREHQIGIERIGHVAIYTGNEQIIHAIHPQVCTEPLSERIEKLITVRRILR